MNYEIDGYQNENEFVMSLNKKKFSSLLPNFQDLLLNLYGNLDNDNVVYCRKDYEKKKFDIEIIVNGIIKRISIKKGINNSVHVERISSFIHFLIDSNVSREAVIEYLRYHYADGTQNGRGINRISGHEYKEQNQDKIDYINEQINNPYVLRRAINRFVLQGKNSAIKVDGIIYGTVNDFLFISSDDVMNILMSKQNIYSTGVHFGNLFCQPMTRNLNYNPKYEKKRFCVQIKWYSIFDDIMEIKNKNILDNIENTSR